MRKLGFSLLGFIAALITLALFTPAGVGMVLFAYGCLLYLLCFDDTERATALLVGFTIGLELLATHRFGLATLCSLIWYGLYFIFSEQLRFTSPLVRFIVALALGLAITSVVLYPPAEFVHRIPSFLVVLVAVTIGGALLQRAHEPSAYELL